MGVRASSQLILQVGLTHRRAYSGCQLYTRFQMFN